MTAPAPSPAEQAVIDRFGIFEPEARVVEEVARAIAESGYGAPGWTAARGMAAAAVAAMRENEEKGARK